MPVRKKRSSDDDAVAVAAVVIAVAVVKEARRWRMLGGRLPLFYVDCSGSVHPFIVSV